MPLILLRHGIPVRVLLMPKVKYEVPEKRRGDSGEGAGELVSKPARTRVNQSGWVSRKTKKLLTVSLA
jgi:hypothetical protein